MREWSKVQEMPQRLIDEVRACTRGRIKVTDGTIVRYQVFNIGELDLIIDHDIRRSIGLNV